MIKIEFFKACNDFNIVELKWLTVIIWSMLILQNMLISVNLTWRQCLFNIILVFQSQTMIKTEEDAAMALQVSNALTQALLQYRLKNVPKEVCIFNKITISKKSGKEEYIHFKIKVHVTTNLVLYNYYSSVGVSKMQIIF